MKKLIVTTFAFAFILSSYQILLTSTQPTPIGRTGAPGEGTCSAVGCHANAGIGDVDFDLYELSGNTLINGYQPGVTYRLNLNLTANTFIRNKYGFAITCLDELGRPYGQFSKQAGDSVEIFLDPFFGRQYLTSTNNLVDDWDFSWTAPTSDSGRVIFYISAVASGDTAFAGTSNAGSEAVTGEVYASTTYFAKDIFFSIPIGNTFITITSEPGLCAGDSMQLLGNHVQSNGPHSYLWTPSSGLNNPTAQYPKASPSSNTTYTFTVFSQDDTTNLRHFVEVGTEKTIHGKALQSNNQPVANSRVFLVDLLEGDSALIALDSTVTDNDGLFSFVTKGDSAYIKVVPETSTYPNLLPGYYDLGLTFDNAIAFNTATCNTQQVSVLVKEGTNPGGPGFIGGFISQGAGKRSGQGIDKLGVLLADTDSTVLTATITEENGYFQFDNLPYGSYTLWVDWPYINNIVGPAIEINDTSELQDSLSFLVLDTVVVEGRPVGINNNAFENAAITMYPNPGHNMIYLNLVGTHYPISLNVYSLHGTQLVSTELNSQLTEIDISNLPAGIYFLHLQSEQGSYTQKVIIQ